MGHDDEAAQWAYLLQLEACRYVGH